MLPVCAALGGAIVPAALYALLTAGSEGFAGWGIPMATDIAFALGVLALFGSRVPVGLKVFLTALAIADDLLAVAVIALFYTPDLSILPLVIAGICVALMVVANRMGVRATCSPQHRPSRVHEHHWRVTQTGARRGQFTRRFNTRRQTSQDDDAVSVYG